MRSDLNNANGELRILRDREEQWDACKFHLESKLKDHEAESKKITTLTASFDADRLVSPKIIHTFKSSFINHYKRNILMTSRKGKRS